MRTLFTPWRYRYISMSSEAEKGCFFCQAAVAPVESEPLVLWRSSHHLVMLNRYPYTNGHVMVAPLDHLADPLQASEEAQAEFWPLVLSCQRVLSTAYSPSGFNMGLNLGQAAGAGVPGHFHFHVVPRWSGDTNFMTVVGSVRLVPEANLDVARKLRPLFEQELG